jgi:hypothetical protein
VTGPLEEGETMVKAFEVVYLNPQDVIFERRGDTLTLTLANGDHYPRVILRSCFPVSDQSSYLSVRDASEEGHPEIGIVEDWTQLTSASREAVADELRLHYFVPEIRRIHEVKEELGFLYWTVQTDKGRQEFVMRNSIIRYTREVSPGHWLFIDINESRYEIPDVTALDARSQRLVQQYLSI